MIMRNVLCASFVLDVHVFDNKNTYFMHKLWKLSRREEYIVKVK